MKLSEYMQIKKITQAELADKLGVKQQNVSVWLTNVARPKLDTIEKIRALTKNKVTFTDWL